MRRKEAALNLLDFNELPAAEPMRKIRDFLGLAMCNKEPRFLKHLDSVTPLWLIPCSARSSEAVGPWVAAAWPATTRARGNPATIKYRLCLFV
jgi:hypothetical protein